jgi:hypothetical protein
MEKEQKKITPYRTSTGIMIGQFYEPRQPIEYTTDMELVQIALINDQDFLYKFWLKNIVYVVSVVTIIISLAIFAR